MARRIVAVNLILGSVLSYPILAWLRRAFVEGAHRSVDVSAGKRSLTLSLALAATFTALGVIIAPFTWFFFLGTKAFPGQHLVNALAGVLIGPWWASLVAILVGIIRNALGIGTIFAFPGGIPGALVVGLAYRLTKRFKNRLQHYAAALFEPIGTVVIGATISLLLVAPLIGWKPLLASIERFGILLALLTLWGGWAISSVTGCALGYIILLALDRFGLPIRRG